MYHLQSRGSPGVSILNEILGRIKLDDALIKENNAILHAFLSSFVAEMRKVDDLFDDLYSTSYYSGSFYSDLRISKPDEFDINLILKLPFQESEFQITHHKQEAGYVKCQLRDRFGILSSPSRLGKFFEDGFLIPEKVRSWFQSVIDRALRSYIRPRSCQLVRVRESGPARTISITKRNGECLDVDLVPVIPCTLDLPRVSLDRRIAAKVGSHLQTFLVAKPPHPLSNRTAGVYALEREITEAKRLWRIHIPEPEGNIIYNVGCAKSIIRLLKLLRDKEQWSVLASYILKTVVMWMIIENSGTRDYWREDKIDDRFLEALKKLAGHVERRNIPYIFNLNCNLIAKMSDREAFNIANRLRGLISKINADPNRLRIIF